jgi:hypothetical protein
VRDFELIPSVFFVFLFILANINETALIANGILDHKLFKVLGIFQINSGYLHAFVVAEQRQALLPLVVRALGEV